MHNIKIRVQSDQEWFPTAPWEWTEARMGVRLLGRAMLGQTVVAAIIYGFVGTDKSNDFDHFAR